MGHRIAKHVLTSANVLEKSTYYISDAQGNTMAVYERAVNASNQSVTFEHTEKHLFGSSRLGVMNVKVPMLGSQNTSYSMINKKHRIGERNYELSNHLGNVLSVISDKPVPHSTNGTTHDYYLADIMQSSDYSPFGVTLSGRNFVKANAKESRRGFNGMEEDDEIKGDGNSYDFGARMLDPRIGRWLTIDPLYIKYPDMGPYVYCGNSSISCYDPDGRLIIFINGEVGAFGNTESSKNNPNRASERYWSSQFVRIVRGGFLDINIKYMDGDVSSSAQSRYDQGYNRAKKDFETILAGLEKDENGKITETVKLVSHSKGAAYAAGFQDAWNELAKSDKNKDKFAENGGTVEFSLMLAAHQGRDFRVKTDDTPTVNIRHQHDDMAWSNVKGDVLNIETDNNQWMYEVMATHTIDGFHFEAFAAIYKFMENSKIKGRYVLKGIQNAVKSAKKEFWDRSKQDYVDDI